MVEREQDNPLVLPDEGVEAVDPIVPRKKYLWRLRGNTDEENLALGIRNVQEIFLSRFHEFTELFPFDGNGQIVEERREEARQFILDTVSSQSKFFETFPHTCLNPRNCPYFQESYHFVLTISFSAWGLELEQDDFSVPKGLDGRYRWRDLESEPLDVVVSRIEAEAREIMSMGIKINYGDLAAAGLSSFLLGVRVYYPGGISQLKYSLGITQHKQSGYWQNVNTIQNEALTFISQGGELTHEGLNKGDKSSLVMAIYKYYPGGIEQLRRDLGVSFEKNTYKIWTKEKIEEEAAKRVDEKGNLTRELLGKRLYSVVSKRYPGGIGKLKMSLGIKPKFVRRSWTLEEIKYEANRFYQETGELTQLSLSEHDRYDLVYAMRKYPGGMKKLKEILGVRPRSIRKWTPDYIEEVAREFVAENGNITYTLLDNKGGRNLRDAIKRNYPGGLGALRNKLNFAPSTRKSKYYWTTETIEEEASIFLEREGSISVTLLRLKGRRDLLSAISKRYPGGIISLKEKLKLEIPSSEEQLLEEYEQLLTSGENVSFEEFMKRRHEDNERER